MNMESMAMKKSVCSLLAALAALAFVVSSGSAEDEKPKKKKEVTAVKCPVAGKEIEIADAKVVEYRNAKVYVCCDKCKAKMDEDAAPFAGKANQQLVTTKQYRQAKCPLTGGKLDKEQKLKVAGTMVRFCCDKCKGKVEAAKGDEQSAMVFADKAFETAFVVAKKKEAGE
jgi:uncharacterized secreted protein with C-terminal beta-propeller domain